MQKILSFFRKEYVNVNHAAILLGSFAFLSQILGLFRDRFIAHIIGPSPILDAYYTAFRIPDFIFISVASLASITVLIPFILSKMDGSVVTTHAKKFLNDVFTLFLLTLIVVSVVVAIFMPYIVRWVTPGFDLSMQAQVVQLSRIMLLSPILLGLSNLFGSITQLFRKFFIYTLSPIFYNVGIIVGVVFLYPLFGIKGMAFGVVLGALMHFLIQAFASVDSGFSFTFSRHIDFKEIKKVTASSLPRTLGLSLNNIALIAIISFASYLQGGSISIFNLSLNLQSVPLGIIGLSYAVAAFPTLTKQYASGNMTDFKNQLKATAKQVIFWSLPVTFLFIVLRAQIVRVTLGSSSFSWDNTKLVAASLAIFSISIVAQGLIALFARAYYAASNTKRPLMVNFFCSIAIIFFAYLFLNLFATYPVFRNFIESLFRVSGISGTEVLMLPLAYSCGTLLNFIFLAYFIKKDFMGKEHFISRTFLQTLIASFIIGAVSYISLNILSPLFGTITFWGIFLQGFISGVLGIIAGLVTLYLLGNEELKELIKVFKTKFWDQKMLPPTEGTL